MSWADIFNMSYDVFKACCKAFDYDTAFMFTLTCKNLYAFHKELIEKAKVNESLRFVLMISKGRLDKNGLLHTCIGRMCCHPRAVIKLKGKDVAPCVINSMLEYRSFVESSIIRLSKNREWKIDRGSKIRSSTLVKELWIDPNYSYQVTRNEQMIFEINRDSSWQYASLILDGIESPSESIPNHYVCVRFSILHPICFGCYESVNIVATQDVPDPFIVYRPDNLANTLMMSVVKLIKYNFQKTGYGTTTLRCA